MYTHLRPGIRFQGFSSALAGHGCAKVDRQSISNVLVQYMVRPGIGQVRNFWSCRIASGSGYSGAGISHCHCPD